MRSLDDGHSPGEVLQLMEGRTPISTIARSALSTGTAAESPGPAAEFVADPAQELAARLLRALEAGRAAAGQSNP